MYVFVEKTVEIVKKLCYNIVYEVYLQLNIKEEFVL